MIINRLNLIVDNENLTKEADEFARKNGCKYMFVTPELVNAIGVYRGVNNGKYKIIVMVDYPKGSTYGTDKFKGMPAEFFLTDGYDLILSHSNIDKLVAEAKSLHSFVKTMIGSTYITCFTINRSLYKDNDLSPLYSELSSLVPDMVKIESSPKVQPTKANLDTHQQTISDIRSHYNGNIIVSGNIDAECYVNIPNREFAVSLPQAHNIISGLCEMSQKENDSGDNDG